MKSSWFSVSHPLTALVFTSALLLSMARGGEKIPPNAKALEDVAAGKLREVRAAWWGFDPTDATAALQGAIDSGARKVLVEKMGAPWVVNKIQLASDQEIFFEPGVEVRAKRGAFHLNGDCLFTALLQSNVTLTGRGATLRMWKSDYDDKAQYAHAEWRHVLCFKSCGGVLVSGLTLADSGGDGIYLGVGRCGVPCSDVVIRDVFCTNNYRQGISVIDARNLLIENCVFTDTWGAAPEAGIDFEPNLEWERLENCVLRNCVAENNRGDGFLFALRSLRAASRPVSIRLENCRTTNCRRSVAFHTGSEDESAAVKGTLDFSRCTFAAGRSAGIAICDKPVGGVRVKFSDCAILDATTNAPDQAPIQFSTSANTTEEFGAVQFERCTVRDPLGRVPPLAYHDLSGGAGLRDITGDLALQRSNETAQVFQLTPALLATWLPHTSFNPIAKFATQGVRYEPALPQAQPDAKQRCMARQRGTSEWLLWAEAGKTAKFSVVTRQVGKTPPKPAPMHLEAPSGAVMELLDTKGLGETDYEFVPTETGAYIIRCEPRTGTVTLNALGARHGLYAPRVAFHLLGTTGKFFFWVPAGTREFAVKVSGENSAERVKATLRDPNGKVAAEADNIFEARQFVASPLNAAQGECWSVQFDKPAAGVLEDYYVQLQGVPPVLTHSPAALLKPARHDL